MCHDHVGSRRDQGPLVSTWLPTWQIKAPVGEIGLPWTSPHLDASDARPTVEQILAIRYLLDHLEALVTHIVSLTGPTSDLCPMRSRSVGIAVFL